MVDSASSSLALKCDELEELSDVSDDIIDFARGLKVWLFEGEMGAGKTTLIKAIGGRYGVTDTINSPTFSIVNEYSNENNEVFYHFDFYRIDSEQEAMDIGVEEYLYSGKLCWIEWPSKINNLLPESYLNINIRADENNTRHILLTRHE